GAAHCDAAPRKAASPDERRPIMSKEQPLWQRIYFDEVFTEVCRAIGYAGCTYREMQQRLEPLNARFDKRGVESAARYLVTYEGQFTSAPKPLAHVRLRDEVRRLCWQLLGPPPEHPDYERFKSSEPWCPPWRQPPGSAPFAHS